MRSTRSALLAAAALAALVGTAGCGSSTPARSGGATSASDSAGVHGTVTVLAAASLTEAFGTLASQFEAAHPGATVKLSFGASSALAQQIIAGAPADVFASAATKNMQQVITAGGASSSSNFVANVMEIAVPPKNPAHVGQLSDLARPGVKVALCQAQVPCGATARAVFDKAGMKVTPVTEEADVKSTLSKVETGEVDAGVVYVTDVRSAGSKVTGVPIPASVNASTEYPIATLSKAANAAGAQAFVAYVLSPAGRAVLAADGFEKP
ncbi:MAG TPA: molybdate ABC transporter substrate-binding protein [Jatrophihabitans sp.]|nr:molybdate ABC transporter substrate-binding protein [Jatrophihabitans sp.]